MIKGFIGTSFVDYPGKVASVIFTGGCNFRCPYCYNIDLVLPERLKELPDIEEERALKELERRKNFIDGVVITGGEPLLHRDKLIRLVEKIKDLGLPVKIDTNGSLPTVLEKLLSIADYIALDVKATPNEYPLLGGNWKEVERSIELLKSSPVEHEFRITAVRGFIDREKLKRIAEILKGAKRVAIQKFINTKTLDPSFEKVIPYTREEMEELASILRPCVEKVILR